MIDAKELRIGNLVYRDKRNEPVPMILPYFSHLHRLDPVPITEEWLLKFGFEIEWYDEGAFYTKRGEYNFDLDGHFDYHRSDGSWIKIKYIHQLQNLYFALTGKELEPKE